MQYTFRCGNYAERYLQVEFQIPNAGLEPIEVQLPAWRPGRYELQNFAKNIRSFSAFRPDGSPLPFQKRTKDRWQIEPKADETVTITYEYYANQLDAGGTFVDFNQWFVNPCTCCLYVVGRESEPVQVFLDAPENYTLAGGWQHNGPLSFMAPNFDTLADAPFIASNELNHRSYQIDEHIFHIWFVGWPDAPWDKILPAFKAFTRAQINAFQKFTVPEYHFLYQILPTRKYHGVEHLNATVICLGPAEEMNEDNLWEQFLGVSSHELYHTWNIKSIRPSEMLPYDLTQENYFDTGYVVEGVTTYMGDLFLAQSQVFNWNQFKSTQEQNLQRHSDNNGNLYASVTESSLDLWLDGYVAGAPQRKVSIYAEGALISLLLDINIRRESEGAFGLQTVMTKLYHDFALQNKGYLTQDYRTLCRSLGGEAIDFIFENHVHGKGHYWKSIDAAIGLVGLQRAEQEHDTLAMNRFGLKALKRNDEIFVADLWQGGIAAQAGIEADCAILKVNDIPLKDTLSDVLAKFIEKEIEITLQSPMRTYTVNMKADERRFFPQQKIIKNPEASDHEKALFKAWCGQDF